MRARVRFDRFRDDVRRAQVNETLARLYIFTERYDLALECVSDAVLVLEKTSMKKRWCQKHLQRKSRSRAITAVKKAKATFADAYKVSEDLGTMKAARRHFFLC